MQKVVVFSGAGMSAESGIETFRDSDGLWDQHRIEDVATPEAWARNPDLVQRFYNARRKRILAAVPNTAHQLIAELDDFFDVEVITQNIDDLHERAGSQNVLHLHGHIRYAKSSGPQTQHPEELFEIESSDLNLDTDKCPDGYPLRPHVVWFGEAVPAYEDASISVQTADIFIVIGTSLAVYPVAGLIHQIRPSCRAFYIDPKADYQRVPQQYELIKEGASEGMKKLFQQLVAP
ncbi:MULTISPECIES: Sir2 family NAD-dependent protein deacetylase [Acinetobacter]|uniref:NAD-dependent protein deacylase n=1 Tax=Acinetobacter chengduensis TaxID=2420890 RepID=A0ABX9TXU5_9GAMM|nr:MULTISPECIES: Sir2 family NAD-dependent protein deacetylase [Acinetobacter]MBI1452285.1 NAD-dependent deacylase [Acinetobacter sp. FL51]RKG43266.1 NAD-dependent deacylase [Acinetobacter sp. WCHAc060007]RLL23107.1 NAD-dependent deacylase [Acinetobacter chengduensis]